jgi:hypothetical protein
VVFFGIFVSGILISSLIGLYELGRVGRMKGKYTPITENEYPENIDPIIEKINKDYKFRKYMKSFIDSAEEALGLNDRK